MISVGSMFSGIVDHCGRVREVVKGENSLTLKLDTEFSDLELGESISVDGVCLTVTQFAEGKASFDVSPETLQLTSLSRLEVQKKVNLERSLTLSTRLGGHFVMGHVDERATVSRVVPNAEFTEMTFSGFSKQGRKYLVKKGSVAVNGVSLTLNEVESDSFEVMLIPHTLERTNLGKLIAGDVVNLEFDWLSRVVIERVEALLPQFVR